MVFLQPGGLAPSMQKKPDDNVAQYKDRTDCAEDDVSDQIQLPFFWNGVGLVPNLSQFAQKLGVPLIVNSQLAIPIRSSRATWNRKPKGGNGTSRPRAA